VQIRIIYNIGLYNSSNLKQGSWAGFSIKWIGFSQDRFVQVYYYFLLLSLITVFSKILKSGHIFKPLAEFSREIGPCNPFPHVCHGGNVPSFPGCKEGWSIGPNKLCFLCVIDHFSLKAMLCPCLQQSCYVILFWRLLVCCFCGSVLGFLYFIQISIVQEIWN
jgi:hypothetical protein